MGFLAVVKQIGNGLVYIEPVSATDPGFGGGVGGGVDPGYGQGGGFHPDQGLPGYGHPGNRPPGSYPGRPDQGLPGFPGRPDNSLPVAPVRPTQPIVLPPGVWPPTLPPGVDNTLPPGQGGAPGQPSQPIVIPPGTVDNELPIHIPSLPAGSALLIPLPAPATPKEGTPPGTKPALMVQAGKKPVLVYVSAAPMPK